MLVLTAETDKIQVVLAGNVTTNQLQCMSSWRDITTTAYTPGRTVINTNNTTDIDLVGSPAASTQRVIDFLSVYNNDTVTANVTVKFDANGTEYILFKGLLATGERLEYTNDGGFKTYSNAGAVKSYSFSGSMPITTGITTVVLSDDVVNNDATANTIADVTGLSFSVTSDVMYWFKFIIAYTSAATATGSRWSLNGPATTLLAYRSTYALAATTQTQNNAVAYDNPAASNATSAATGGNIAIIEGFIRPSANGTLIARFASEVANSAITAKAGSIVQYMAVA
jgi:hypothetical protein